MGRTGRPPKSTEQHNREGTIKRTRQASTPLTIGGRKKPTPPTYLSKDAKRFFRQYVNELWEGNVLDKADRAMVLLAAIDTELIAGAYADVELRGRTVKQIRGGYNGSEEREVEEANPNVAILDRAIARLRQTLRELGIGPSARASLNNAGVGGRTPATTIPALAAFALKAVPDGKKKTG